MDRLQLATVFERSAPSATLVEASLAPSRPAVFWTEGDHVHPKRPRVVQDILALMFEHIARGYVKDGLSGPALQNSSAAGPVIAAVSR